MYIQIRNNTDGYYGPSILSNAINNHELIALNRLSWAYSSQHIIMGL